MKNRKRRLVAGFTASGTVLCLTLSADGHGADQRITRGLEHSVPSRVESLREKLNAGFPQFGRGADNGQIRNIVQFFNFSNCARTKSKNC
jgi:hypothetical protein